MDRRDEYLTVFGGAAAIAILSLLTALVASAECGGDGTFDPDGPLATPSDFCTSTRFPGLPDSLSSWALVAALFAGPAVLALGAGLVSIRTRRPRLRAAGGWVAFGLVIAIAVFVLDAADTGYKGAG